MIGRDDNGSFPLGSRGCSVAQNGDKQKGAQRGSVLKSKVRMPTMEDVITALSYVVALWMIKMIVKELSQVHSVGGVFFRLSLHWTHRLTTTDIGCMIQEVLFFGGRGVKYGLWFLRVRSECSEFSSVELGPHSL